MLLGSAHVKAINVGEINPRCLKINVHLPMVHADKPRQGELIHGIDVCQFGDREKEN